MAIVRRFVTVRRQVTVTTGNTEMAVGIASSQDTVSLSVEGLQPFSLTCECQEKQNEGDGSATRRLERHSNQGR